MNTPDPRQRRDPIATAAMTLIAVLAALRGVLEHEPFPYWTHDPFVFAPPITGLLDARHALLCGAVCVGAAVVIARCAGSWSPLRSGLLALGGAALGAHIIADPTHLTRGATLGAALAALLAADSYIARFPRHAGVLLGGGVGLGLFMLLEGAHQVFVEHPQTLRYFEQNGDAILAARGWERGSFEALSYERRLRQPEPTAWFGLANVFGGFVGALGVGALIVSLRTRDRWIRPAWGFAALTLVAGLTLSGAKGAWGAAAMGALALGAEALIRRRTGRSRPGGLLVVAGAVLTLGVVLGGALGQLSLVFRTQYLLGALRIFAGHPLIGVGPGGFQDAYMIAKPETSPEDVASAHHIVFDLLAQLGAGGLAWCALLVMLVVAARPVRDAPPEDDPVVANASLTRLGALGVLVVAALSVRVRAGVLDPGHLGVLALGAGLWAGAIAFAAARPLDASLARLGSLGAASVLALHALFDLGAVWIVSAPIWGLLVGAGLAGGRGDGARRARAAAATILAALGALMVWVAIPRLETQHELIRLGERAAAYASIRDRLSDGTPGTASEREGLEREIGSILGRPIALDDPSLSDALARAERGARVSAARGLLELGQRARDERVTRSAIEHAILAARASEDSSVKGTLWRRAMDAGERLAMSARASSVRWSGRVALEYAGSGLVDPDKARALRTLAYERWKEADALAPHDPHHAARVMDLALKLGDTDAARGWARRAIARSEAMALDPIRRLPDETLARARSIAGGDG